MSDRSPRSRRGKGGITLSDVAKLAGVSAITVSRALNTPNAVSPQTLARVTEAVHRTGYVPNLLAGGLASNRSRLVAALVPTVAGPMFMETVQALTAALERHGYQLMLGQSGYYESREDALIDAIIGRRPDGIVLTGILHSPQGRKRLTASGIPVVETWDLTPTPIDMLVGFSHQKVGHSVAEYLYRKGYRRPAVISADDLRALQRRDAFIERMQALLASDHPIPVSMVSAPTTLRDGRSALAQLLDTPASANIDCVFCSSDLLAHGVVTEAQARKLKIPQRLAVFGFGNLGFSAHVHPALSTVHIDGQAIGEQAARFIVSRLNGENGTTNIHDIGFELIERESA